MHLARLRKAPWPVGGRLPLFLVSASQQAQARDGTAPRRDAAAYGVRTPSSVGTGSRVGRRRCPFSRPATVWVPGAVGCGLCKAALRFDWNERRCECGKWQEWGRDYWRLTHPSVAASATPPARRLASVFQASFPPRSRSAGKRNHGTNSTGASCGWYFFHVGVRVGRGTPCERGGPFPIHTRVVQRKFRFQCLRSV